MDRIVQTEISRLPLRHIQPEDRFYSVRSLSIAHAIGREWHELKDKLAPSSAKAVAYFKGHGCRAMNAFLRKDRKAFMSALRYAKAHFNEDLTFDEFELIVEDAIHDLDLALAGGVTTHSVIAYRVANSNALVKELKSAKENMLTQKAYVSTSLYFPAIAGMLRRDKPDGVLMRILVPAFSKGIYMEHEQGGNLGDDSEAELLLPHGSKFKILRKHEDDEGILHVLAEHVPVASDFSLEGI